jgi:hypothetical protein
MNLLKTRGADLQKNADKFQNGNFHLHDQAIALYNQYLRPSRVAEAPLPQPALPWAADYYTLYIIYRWMDGIYRVREIIYRCMDRIYRAMEIIYRCMDGIYMAVEIIYRCMDRI